MAPPALRPRSATEIVDTAVQVLKAHYGQFVICSALAYTPWLVLQLLVMADSQDILRRGWAFGSFMMLGVWVTFAIMSAMLITLASRAYLGESVDVGVAARAVLPVIPRVVAVALLRYLLLFLGLLAFLVGALYVGARFFAVHSAIVLEDRSVAGAFARSSELSSGRKLHVIYTFGLVIVIYWALGIGLTMLAMTFGNYVVQVIVGALFTILAYPLIAITETLLYYDARIQREGLDIEMMTNSLGLATTPGPAVN